ncbi:hypothetical protein RB601_001230 [Gaeumannomyces tritici]
MKWTALALSAFAGLAAAHGDQAMPHIVGDRQLASELRARGFTGHGGHGHGAHMHGVPLGRRSVSELRARQNVDGQCGPGLGKCAAGYCCSSAGWCGQGNDYCAAPDCQINYGPGCDALKVPKGSDTSGVARTKVGNVPYGGLGIYDCVNNGDIAITYDDGPYLYTNDLLNTLKKYNAFATFFITGNNLGKGQLNDPATPWPAILKRMAAEGHQIASHTWSHQNASQLNAAQMKEQMIYNEIAIANVLGYFPTYMRPPYSICEKLCQTTLSTLGYHVIYFDLDTEGYLKDSATQIQGSKDIWDAAVGPANPATTSFLHIEHDLQFQAVYNLTEYMLISLNKKGFKSVTVGECLGDDPKNWYRSLDKPVPAYPPPGVSTTAPSPTNAASSSANAATASTSASASATGSATSSATNPLGTLKASVDGNCGNGITCIGWADGSCCSQHGWCGGDDNYCGAGCQPAFGICAGGGGGSSAGSSATAATASNSASATSGAANPLGTLKASVEGDCGNGVSCLGWAGGSCCSQYGWCGGDDGYCGDGCQSAFGTCANSPAVSSSVPLTPDGGAASSTASSSSSSSSSSAASSIASSSSTVSAAASSSATTSSQAAGGGSSSSSSSSSSSPSSTSVKPTSTAQTSATSTTAKLSTTSTTAKVSPTPTSTAIKVSTNGNCGKAAGMTCNGSKYAPCCSSKNKCDWSCFTGCQKAYGWCL